MKNKIESLTDRLISINTYLGDIDLVELNNKSNVKSLLTKQKLKNFVDVINSLQREVSENDSITFKDTYKKCMKFYLFSSIPISTIGDRKIKIRKYFRKGYVFNDYFKL